MSAPATSPTVETPPAQGLDASGLVRRHGVSASVGRILNLIAASSSVFFLARLLEPDDFGQFIVVRTALSVLGMLAAFGLETTSLRLLGTCLTDPTPDRRRRILGIIAKVALLTFSGTALLAAAATLLFGSHYIDHPVSWSLVGIVALGTIASGGITIVTDALRGIGRPGIASLLGFARGQGSSIVHVGVIAMLGFTYLLTPPTWEIAVAIYVVVVSITVAGAGWVLIKAVRSSSTQNACLPLDAGVPTSLGGILQMSWPVAAASLLTILTVSVDLFLTSNFPESEGVGPYVAARRIIILLSIPMSILNQTSLGIISPMLANDMRNRLEQVLRSGATLVTIPCAIAAAILLIAPKFVLWIILGPGYDDAAILLQVLIPGQVVYVMTGACVPLLTLTGHQRTIIQIDLLIITIMTLGGAWVSTAYGAIGLAVLFSAGTAARNLLQWDAARRITHINTGFGFGMMPQWRTFLQQYRRIRRPRSVDPDMQSAD